MFGNKSYHVRSTTITKSVRSADGRPHYEQGHDITRCANSQGGILRCSIGINLDYSWNVASTSLSRCRLQKVDRVKLNSAS